MKYAFVLWAFILFVSCSQKIVPERTVYFPQKQEMLNETPDMQNLWVFIMAGQSNMAGRGIVEPNDTIANKRILSINQKGELVIAKEPLHWYEPERTGLDCGYSFAMTLIRKISGNKSVLLIPTAVGGSSISQWLGDSMYRNVKLFSNFKEKTEIAKQFGVIKGILWHQGESDANEKDIPLYKQRLSLLFSKFRATVGNNDLPILLGELGSFSDDPLNFDSINKQIHAYAGEDKNTLVISTKDLKDKGDHLHFNSEGQRKMGKRFAEAWLKFY
jgi:hypothetical protein